MSCITSTDVKYDSLSKRYHMKNMIGSGSFGHVHTAVSKQSGGQLVAVKTLNQVYNGPATDLREVRFYLDVPVHPNLVDLLEMFKDESTGQMNFVMELMDTTMLGLIKSRKGEPLQPMPILRILEQVLLGLNHIHSNGYIHRDLKPENILIRQDSKSIQVKLADFGLTRKIDSNHRWTSYVATRWYRAPEQLAKLDSRHDTSLDVWAFGLLMAELCNLRALFPGKTTADMIIRLIQVLGTPSSTNIGGSWRVIDRMQSYMEQEGIAPSESFEFILNSFKHKTPSILPQEIIIFKELEPMARVIYKCLKWNAARRPSIYALIDAIRQLPHMFEPSWRANYSPVK